jgi:heptosyltransferase-1
VKILIVKTSSLGDVVQMLPAIEDIRAHFAHAQIDWVVEESFQAVPALHPALHEVIPIAIRRWRRKWGAPSTWREVRSFRQRLRRVHYDAVLDSQGLLKSALVARQASGTLYGFSRSYCRESVATLLYRRTVSVPPDSSAVEAYRLLAAGALNYTVRSPAVYGIAAPAVALPFSPGDAYGVLLHSSARDDKLWPEPLWVEVANALQALGLRVVLPWGSAPERERSMRLSAALPGAIIPPPLSLAQAAVLLDGARIVIGVDTGLAYLASALGRPVVRLYCGIDRGRTRLYVPQHGVNLGGEGRPPPARDVISAVRSLLRENPA